MRPAPRSRYRIYPLLCILTLTQASSQILSFKSYSVKDGLPSNTIEVIYQDTRGYMWFGTTDGISVFDGRAFTNYTMHDGLPHNYVTEIFEDRVSRNTMWILAGGHVCRFSNGSFFTYVLPVASVRSIYQDHEGVVWCATDRGVITIRGEKVAPFRHAILDMLVAGIAETADSVLWFAVDRALLCHSYSTHEFARVELREYGGGIISSLLGDTNGNLWVGLVGGQILNVRNKQVANVRPSSNLSALLAEDGNGNLWVAGYDGIGSVVTKEFATAPWLWYTTNNGLQENTIRSISFDREGDIWIGGRDNGLMKLSPLRTDRFPLGTIDSYSLSHNLSYAVSDRNNHIWIISNSGLQELWRDNWGRWRNHTHTYDQRDPRTVGSLFCDSRGRLWVMCGLRGNKEFPITCYDVDVDRNGGPSLLTKVKTITPRPWAGLLCVFIVDRKGVVWQSIGSLGIVRLDSSNPNLNSRIFGEKDGVPTNYIRALCADRQGNIWGGGFSSGLVMLSMQDTTRVRVTRYNPDNGLPGWGIWSIMEDKAGRILVGMSNSGLAIFEGDSIRTLSVKDGLPSNTVHCMTEDSLGRLWIGTTVGMAYEDQPGSKRFLLNKALMGASVYCCGTTGNGLLWFVTPTDLYVYDYRNDRKAMQPPPVFITRLEVNGEGRSIGRELELSHNENNAEIRFIGLSFKDEEAIRYLYRLEGAEKGWQGPTKDNSITYGHLAPGSYKFEVKAINVDGTQSSQPASLSLTILPAFWRTWWFLLSAMLASVLVGVVISYQRVSRLKKEQLANQEFSRRLIESQEAERKRVAGELHDGLGQELMVIINRSQLALKAQTMGRVKEQLNEIAQTTSRAIEDVREMAYNLSPYHLEQLGLTDSIKTMVEKMASLSTIQFSMNIDPIDSRFSKNVEINVYRLVQECITNVVKHSKASCADVTIKNQDHQLEMVVRDDGIGFDVATGGTHEGKRRGFGLAGLCERVTLLNGSLSITSSAGKGTTVTIAIPYSSSTTTQSPSKLL